MTNIIYHLKVKVTQLYPTLCDPLTIQPMEFSRPEYWSGQPFPSPPDLPNPGIETRSPTLQADSLPTEPQENEIQRMIQMNLYTKQTQTENKLMVPREESDGGGINQEYEINKQWYIKQMSKKDLLYSTGKYIQYLEEPIMGNNTKYIDICM